MTRHPYFIVVLASLALPSSAIAAEMDLSVSRNKAMELAKGLGSENCPLLFESERREGFEPESFGLEYKHPGNETSNSFLLFRIPCWLAAYNQGDAYVLIDEYGEGRALSFAVPDYDVVYEAGSDDKKVKSITITGYATRSTLVLSRFDPETMEASEFFKSRGMGDAFTSGTWKFDGDGFVLKNYQVDASYDGNRDGQVIVDFAGSKKQ